MIQHIWSESVLKEVVHSPPPCDATGRLICWELHNLMKEGNEAIPNRNDHMRQRIRGRGSNSPRRRRSSNATQGDAAGSTPHNSGAHPNGQP